MFISFYDLYVSLSSRVWFLKVVYIDLLGSMQQLMVCVSTRLFYGYFTINTITCPEYITLIHCIIDCIETTERWTGGYWEWAMIGQ